MTDLSPLTALGADTPRTETLGPLSLRENSGMGLASVALRRGSDQPAPFGLALPGPGHWTAGTGCAAFWTAPGQWMIEGEGRGEEDFAHAVADQAPGCSVTEQTDGWVCIEITSTNAATLPRLMEKLVNIAPDRLQPGMATRTGLEHQSVFVIRRAPDQLAIWGMRSSAGSLWHALTTAGRTIREST